MNLTRIFNLFFFTLITGVTCLGDRTHSLGIVMTLEGICVMVYVI